jgi:hypothetical protein
LAPGVDADRSTREQCPSVLSAVSAAKELAVRDLRLDVADTSVLDEQLLEDMHLELIAHFADATAENVGGVNLIQDGKSACEGRRPRESLLSKMAGDGGLLRQRD